MSAQDSQAGAPAAAPHPGELPSAPEVQIRLGHHPCGDGHPLVIIAGLCVIETRDHTLWIAEQLKRIAERAGMPLIFKASYDKANRSALDSYRGPGAEKGLHILEDVRNELGLSILTDIHSAEEADSAGEVADVIQIPAFLCRQTDILVAAGKTGCAVNVKKGQFLAPEDMTNVARKILSTGNPNILMTERGTSFGYHTLVVDYRSLLVMRQKCRLPVCFDATHAVQEPGALGRSTGGRREFVGPLARAAAAIGVDALFFEVHDNPALALSDGPNALDLESFPRVLEQVRRIDEMIRS